MTNLSLLLLAASDPLGELVEIIMWVARCLILFVGGGVGFYFIVNGKGEENPKKTYEGYLSIVAAGLIFGATFAVEKIFS